MLSRFSPACRRRGNFTCEVDANMSMPNLPDVQIDREGGINAILAAIGMEELSLAHLLNAEGEKLQKILSLNVDQETILAANQSVESMVNAIANLESILKLKLELFDGCECDKTIG